MTMIEHMDQFDWLHPIMHYVIDTVDTPSDPWTNLDRAFGMQNYGEDTQSLETEPSDISSIVPPPDFLASIIYCYVVQVE